MINTLPENIKEKKKKIAFIILSDPMIYPPTMNAAAILADHGILVDIYGLKYRTADYIEPTKGVSLKYLGELRRGLRLRLDFASYCAKMCMIARRNSYDWIFSYNMISAFPGYLSAKVSGARWLYHNHDLNETKRAFGFYPFLKMTEQWTARRADLVVFPQAERADLFARSAGLPRKPIIVGNGPRVRWPNVEGLDQEVVEFRRRCGLLAIYQGGLNWRRGLRRLIQSMPLWSPAAGLLLIGGMELEPTFEDDAFVLAKDLGVQDRLMIRGTAPYASLPRCSLACDVGIGVLANKSENESINIANLAGASNKLVEYMACGLPIVAPNSTTYEKYIVENDIGVLANSDSKEDIAIAINRLLQDTHLRQKQSSNGKNLFMKKYSYDQQFEKVLKMLLC